MKRMKRLVLVPIAACVVVIVMGTTVMGTTAASASTATPRAAGPAVPSFLCNEGDGLCLNSSADVADTAIIEWPVQAGAHNMLWSAVSVGTVGCSSTKCWPFTAGSGLNAAYSGDTVVQWNLLQGMCLGDANLSSISNLVVSLQPCGLSNWWHGIDWVDVDGSGYINVDDSNGFHTPEWLTATGGRGSFLANRNPRAVGYADWVTLRED